MKPIDCAKKGCCRKATHHIGLRVWPQGQPKLKHNFFESSITLALCHRHAVEATKDVDMIVTDEAWGQINAACHKASKAIPDRATVEIFTIQGLPQPFLMQVAAANRKAAH